MVISKFQTILIVFALLVGAAGVVCPSGSSAIPSCKTCTTSGTSIVCSECLPTYYLTSSTCVSCSTAINNCASCALNLASQPTCFICKSGYGLLNGACQDCSAISGCANCTIVNYNLQCSLCSPGLVLYSAVMQCVACPISNCASCAVSNAGSLSCSTAQT